MTAVSEPPSAEPRRNKSSGQTRSSLPRLDNSSLAERALSGIVAAIQEGAFEAGKLPSEPDLARQLGVSRTTVRAALTSLDQVGILERRPGLGTRLRPRVTHDVLALHGLVPFSTLLSINHRVTTKAHLQVFEFWTAELTQRLGHVPSGVVHLVERVLYADDRVAMLLKELIPDETLRMPLRKRSLQDSIIQLSDTHFHHGIDYAIATLAPKTADKLLATQFGVTAESPYVLLQETFYSASNAPLAIADVSANPALIDLSVVRRLAGQRAGGT